MTARASSVTAYPRLASPWDPDAATAFPFRRTLVLPFLAFVFLTHHFAPALS